MTHNTTSQIGAPPVPPTALPLSNQPLSQPLPPQTSMQTGQSLTPGFSGSAGINNLFSQAQANNPGIAGSQGRQFEQAQREVPPLGLNNLQRPENAQMLDAIVNASAQTGGQGYNRVDSQLRALEQISSSLMQIQQIVEDSNRRHSSIECPSIISQILQEQQRMMLAELSPTSRQLMRSIVEPTPLQELLSDMPSGINPMSTLLQQQRQLQNSLAHPIPQTNQALFPHEAAIPPTNLQNQQLPEAATNAPLNFTAQATPSLYAQFTSHRLASLLNAGPGSQQQSQLGRRTASQALPQNIEPRNRYPQPNMNLFRPSPLDWNSSLLASLMNQGLRELSDILPPATSSMDDEQDSDFLDMSSFPLQQTQEDI